MVVIPGVGAASVSKAAVTARPTAATIEIHGLNIGIRRLLLGVDSASGVGESPIVTEFSKAGNFSATRAGKLRLRNFANTMYIAKNAKNCL